MSAMPTAILRVRGGECPLDIPVRIPIHEPNKKTHFHGSLSLARDEGFEPPIMGPEPIALPLGQSLLLLLRYAKLTDEIIPYKRHKWNGVVEDVKISRLLYTAHYEA